MTDERIVEAMARGMAPQRFWQVMNDEAREDLRIKARAALAALRGAGFDVYRPDDCMETEACAHCVTASIPLDHRMEAFYLVPVGGDS